MSTEAKLMPPILPDQLRAGYGNVLTVNFQHSRAVSLTNDNDLYLELKIRTIPNNLNPIDTYGTLQVQVTQSMIDNGYVTFSLSNDDSFENYLNIGQHYKVQMKYVRNSTPKVDGYISNVGIMKYTSTPELSISSSDGFTYVGTYSQKYEVEGETIVGDYSEKVYSYKFDIYKSIERREDELLETSGWVLHDSSTDNDNYESHDTYLLYKLYFYPILIKYSVRTNNNLPESITTVTSEVIQPWVTRPVQAEPDVIQGEYDFDNGLVRLVTYPMSDYKRAIVRKNKDYDDSFWGEIIYVTEKHGSEVFYDFTVEQGVEYDYFLFGVYDAEQHIYDMGGPVNINVDYEDMFLTDSSGRQLKVRYNPTVSAIHETILESKTDTIGGKYPFFSRNQSVRYRDFQIGGLISLQMDEQHLFSELLSLPNQPSRERTLTTAAQDNQYLEDIKTYGYSSSLTDYSAPNYYRERMFRDEVLAWLNNGEYKLFRSPSEGMLIVCLLSVNMTPYNGTSRMIYSFTAQAYEAMGHDIPDLAEFGLLRIEPINIEGGE